MATAVFDAAVVECAGGTIEGDGVAGVTLAVGMKEIRGVNFAI